MRFISTVGLCCLASGLAFSNPTEPPLSAEDVALADRLATNLAYLNDLLMPHCKTLFAEYNYDSNRFCRVAKDIYRRYPRDRPRNLALTMIDLCSDTNQVPFLDSCVTDLRMGPKAISILTRHEGFSSNSVLRTARYHAITNENVFFADRMAYSDRIFALERLVFAATRSNVPAHLKDFTRDYVYSFASNNCSSVNAADRELMNLDPTFKNSKRRLALLRYAQPRTHEPYVPQYLATEIRKLEEYPEENLPE